MKNIILLAFLIFATQRSFAEGELHPVINSSLGMYNLTITENASTLSENPEATSADADGTTSTTSTGPASTAAAVTAFELSYEFLHFLKKSYFINAIVPLVSTDGSGIFLGSIGVNFYLNSLSTLFSYKDSGAELIMRPTMRYYWGGSAGVGYVVYNTDTAKKADVFFDLGLHGGLVYNITQKYAARLQLGIGRGTGVAASSTGVKVFLGMSYYLDK